MKKNIKTYDELIKINSFLDRYNYLRLDSYLFNETFGSHRYLNQMLYNSLEWKKLRREIILRDNGFDLAHEDFPINNSIYIHHINPITIDDILNKKDCVFDKNNLISVSYKTHYAIHYGTEKNIPKYFVDRFKNDTCPWKSTF